MTQAMHKREKGIKAKESGKKPLATTACLQQAADWLGAYSRILENMQVARSVR